jgi:hypothetical protein
VKWRKLLELPAFCPRIPALPALAAVIGIAEAHSDAEGLGGEFAAIGGMQLGLERQRVGPVAGAVASLSNVLISIYTNSTFSSLRLLFSLL